MNFENLSLKTLQPLTLDFYQSELKTFRAKQYDKGSRFARFRCTDHGTPFPLDQNTMKVYFKMLTPDNRAIYADDCISIQEDGTVLLEMTESMLAASGRASAELIIMDINQQSTLSTLKFDILIEGSVYEEDRILASDEFSALTEIITKEKERYESMTALEESVQAAEAIRSTTENQRNEAESERIAAEEKRQQDTAAAIAATEAATEQAVTAADNATEQALTAAANAQTAADATNAAIAEAVTATQEANAATDVMNTLIADDNVVHTNLLGNPGGVATLDQNGNVLSSQLPSYVDDVLDGTASDISVDETTGSQSAAAFILTGQTEPCTPESGKIYVDVADGVTYRWSGSIFVSIGNSLALGTTSAMAFPGDRGLSLEEQMDSIEAALAEKVDKVDGKQLSTNDFTDEDKNILDSLSDISTIQEIEVTLPASGWVGASAPYTQTILVTDLPEHVNCSISIGKNATHDQAVSIANAEISDISYDAATGFTFTATGLKPAIDVPILISAGASMNVVEAPKYAGTTITTLPASKISYDNAASGMAAETVQTAMDELSGELADAAANINGLSAGLEATNSSISALNSSLEQVNTDLAGKQNASTAITTANISSQSVKYATTAGSAVDSTARTNANAALAKVGKFFVFSGTFGSANASEIFPFGTTYGNTPIFCGGRSNGADIVANGHITSIYTSNTGITINRDSAASYADSGFTLLLYVP